MFFNRRTDYPFFPQFLLTFVLPFHSVCVTSSLLCNPAASSSFPFLDSFLLIIYVRRMMDSNVGHQRLKDSTSFIHVANILCKSLFVGIYVRRKSFQSCFNAVSGLIPFFLPFHLSFFSLPIYLSFSLQ